MTTINFGFSVAGRWQEWLGCRCSIACPLGKREQCRVSERSGGYGCAVAITINESPLPEFQHQQVPQELCMVGFATAMCIKQAGNNLRSKTAPLYGAWGQEDVIRHVPQFLTEPRGY